MKKYFTTSEYKKRNLKHAKKQFRRKLLSVAKLKAKNRLISGIPEKKKKRKLKTHVHRDVIKPLVLAPSDLRLIENAEGCLYFFRDLRSQEYLSHKGKINFVIMSLKEVTSIDYGAISILTAISEDLKFNKIILKGDFPDDPYCKQFLIDSGFLNHMIDEHGKEFPKAEKSELIFFEKGSGILLIKDNIAISNTVKNVVKHLTGELKQCLAVKSIVLEICGNSIEWGGTQNRQWLLGVKYEPEKVIFTVTDVGKGILETLHRRFGAVLTDIFSIKSNLEILRGAFTEKYGSSTKEINRNKGLPAVKYNFDNAVIKNLKVLTNNVILQFDNEEFSKTFEKGKPRFHGTFYQWVMTMECINNISNN